MFRGITAKKGSGNKNVTKKGYLAKQKVFKCTIILCTFLCGPLQNNNVK